MAHGPNEHDLLAWIEGEALPPEASDGLERAFAADASLRSWAEAARSDRDRLRALAEIEATRAPRGMAEAAMELAEREALVGGAVGAPTRRARRVRITPLRFVAAAGLVIAAGAATLVGFLSVEQPSSPTGEFAQGAGEITSQLAIADQSRAASPESAELAPDGGATPALASAPLAKNSDEAGGTAIAAGTLSYGRAEGDLESRTAPLRFRLIYPSEHAPEHALTPQRAADLASQGRTLLLVRAADPVAVEAALLKDFPDREATAARWRQLVDMPTGGPGFDAARLVVADALTTPAAMERLIADVTTAGGGVRGAWLQELAEPVKLETEFIADDLMWWESPPTAWAPRAAVPVLIERVDPSGPDADVNDPARR